MNNALTRCGCSLIQLANKVIAWMEAWISPTFDLAIRLYVSQVFIASGLTKIQDWGSTLALFETEYHVPLLPPALAAAMGAGGELILPILLILGLAGRFGAAGLFVLNATAVISYPDLSDLGRQDHLLWGSLLLVIIFHGAGRWSFDNYLNHRWARHS